MASKNDSIVTATTVRTNVIKFGKHSKQRLL